jgi:excisionase family DNA binding protein
MTTPGPTPLWRVRDAAQHYGESERTIRQWIEKGALAAVKVGGTIRILPPSEGPRGGQR